MGKTLGDLCPSRKGFTCGPQPGGILVVCINMGIKQWVYQGFVYMWA